MEKLTAEDKKELEAIALDSVCKGEVGLILMAGGQGTRLGCSFPKGQYDIELLSHKPLFHLQADRIRRVEEMAFQKFGKSMIWRWDVTNRVHGSLVCNDQSNDSQRYACLYPLLVVLNKIQWRLPS